MDFQKAFDHISRHLLTQSMCCENEGNCMYRGHDESYGPTACAIGSMILDEHYNKRFEGKAVYSNSVLKALNKSGWEVNTRTDTDFLYAGGHSLHDRNPDIYFLRQFQEIHDNRPVKEWLTELHFLADCYDLDKSVLQEFDPTRETSGEPA